MSTTLRRFLLVTLTHGEAVSRLHYSPKLIVAKIRSLLICNAIIVAKEIHLSGGFHYHVGVLNESASSKTVTRELRKLFQEFEGKQLNVSFHKSWNTVCSYVIKQDKTPYCWNIKLEEVEERTKRQRRGNRNLDSISMLKECETWNDVLEHPTLGAQVLRSYSSVKQTWNDLKGSREQQPLLERLREYVELEARSTGEYPKPYSEEELGTRAGALEWLASNLESKRELRKPQLLIIGNPMTGKTRFIQDLENFLTTYVVPIRSNDFSGATINVDLWVIDEFDKGRFKPQVLNALLDGQRVGLDCKYGNIFYKDKNIPIVLLSNSLAKFADSNLQKAFITRVQVTEFLSPESLEVNRVASTLLSRLEKREHKESLLLASPSPKLFED